MVGPLRGLKVLPAPGIIREDQANMRESTHMEKEKLKWLSTEGNGLAPFAVRIPSLVHLPDVQPSAVEKGPIVPCARWCMA